MQSPSLPNLPALFFERASRGGDSPLFYTKTPSLAKGQKGQWQAWSWNQIASDARALSASLRDAGVAAGDRVAIVSENRPEWAIADIAIMMIGAIAVSVYTTHSPADHQHVFSNSGAAVAIVSTTALAAQVMAGVKDGELQHLFLIDDGDLGRWQDRAVTIHRWREAAAGTVPRFAEREWHQQAVTLMAAIPPDSLAQITYSSGTGGAPRGIMLSHRNIMSNIVAAEALIRPVILRDWFRPVPRVFLSFLPLSHSYEHTAGLWLPILLSAEVYYAESAAALPANLQEVRPTIMTLVPRLFEMLYGRISNEVEKAPPLKRWLFHKTLATSRAKYQRQQSWSDWLLDPVLGLLVRRRVRQKFGGRIRALVSGGAALSTELAEYFHGLGVPVCQGYGQTETAPVVACNSPIAPRLHTVGRPLAGVTVRIAEDGEILVQGDNVMVGYWNDPEATAGSLVNGWLHTGDIGLVDEDGYLIITDRKRDIIKLSGGDTLSPARIEGRLGLEPEIHQAMVFASKSSGAFVVALIVTASPRVTEEAIRQAIERANRDLTQPERIRKFAIAREAFTIENGLMTPTLKLRRHLISREYEQEIAKL
ncbi:MAG: AMP-dependent synthetase/ligase [Alphaproteobacteria bacterium]|nr:AMP-dependent synthetase/ligase [Alphaproteobacteria bacterium]